MYEVRSIWTPRIPLTDKQKKSADFSCCPVIGPWRIGPSQALLLTDAEYQRYEGQITKLVACDCVKTRQFPGNNVEGRLVTRSEAPVLPADPTKPSP